MKNIKNTLKIGVLCLGAAVGSFQNAKADWFVFPENSSLTEAEQMALKSSFGDTLEANFFYLGKQLTGNLISTMVKEWQKARLTNSEITLGKIIYAYLLDPTRYEQDKKKALSINTGLLDLKNLCNLALNQDGDGLINECIRETVQKYVGIWSSKKCREAFDVLWESLTESCDLSAVGVDVSKRFLKKYPNLENYFEKIQEADGENICEKIANCLGDLFLIEINRMAEECCNSCSCLKETLRFTQTYVEPLLSTVLAIIKAITILAATV